MPYLPGTLSSQRAEMFQQLFGNYIYSQSKRYKTNWRLFTVSNFDCKYPIVHDAFHRGKLINFGCITLNQEKFLFERKILPWTDIKNIKLHQGLLYIYTKKNTWTIQVGLISNIYVLLSLIDEIILPASEPVVIQRQPQREPQEE